MNRAALRRPQAVLFARHLHLPSAAPYAVRRVRPAVSGRYFATCHKRARGTERSRRYKKKASSADIPMARFDRMRA